MVLKQLFFIGIFAEALLKAILGYFEGLLEGIPASLGIQLDSQGSSGSLGSL